MLILAFEANSALSRKNETKIVKITHSAVEDKHYYILYGNHSLKRVTKKLSKIINRVHNGLVVETLISILLCIST